MLITSINIDAFGKLTNKTINLSDGINIIYGDNESGKSTTHAFIKAMLFGLKKKKGKASDDDYARYYPWEKASMYGGSLSFIYNNIEYKITRKFEANSQNLQIINLERKGEIVNDPELFLNKVLNNLTVSSFENTISIAQLKSAQDSKSATEFHRIIANLNTTGDMSIDALYAINKLIQMKDDLYSKIDSNATINYNRLLGNIRSIEREISNKKYDNKLPELIYKRSVESKRLSENNSEIEALKNEIINNELKLEKYGFSDERDIDALSLTTSKIFLDYKPLLKNTSKLLSITLNLISLFIGIAMIILSIVFLIATYPEIAKTLNIADTRYSLNSITNFLIHLPCHPILLISFLICIGLILLLSSIIMIANRIKLTSQGSEYKNMLSEIFNKQIDSSEVSVESMMRFKEHIKDMRKTLSNIKTSESRIIYLNEENNTLLTKQSEYEEDIKSQQKNQYDVDHKINELNKLKIENEKLKTIIQKNDVINTEIESINLAIETIKSLSDEIKVSFGSHLNKSASEYIRELTNGKYDSINIDNSLNVTINYNSKLVPLSDTSIGTIDQLYLALRLAMADIISDKRNSLPLIFDDCFAMYDNIRLESTLKFLKRKFATQVIIFTCHKRESEIMLRNKLKANIFNL